LEIGGGEGAPGGADGRITRWEAERVIDLPVPEAH
jgi:hypothetical protein